MGTQRVQVSQNEQTSVPPRLPYNFFDTIKLNILKNQISKTNCIDRYLEYIISQYCLHTRKENQSSVPLSADTL